MVMLATPISDLFLTNTSAIEEIVTLSDCFEGREKLHYQPLEEEVLFHFDINVVTPFTISAKQTIEEVLSANQQLKVISFHISACCTEPILKDAMFYVGGDMLSPDEMYAAVRENMVWLTNACKERKLCIAVENTNFYPTDAYQHITDGEFISRIVSSHNLFFLFDIAHAYITAHNRNIGYREYISTLPLDRMIQLHISQHAVSDSGCAYDAHESPDDLMFDEVKRIVDRYAVPYLTIEFYKDPEKVITLLKKYRELCSA